MTTYQHADWKTTPLYRSMLRVGWILFFASAGWAVVGAVMNLTEAYWMAAATGGLAIVTSLLLPDPVPATYFSETKTHVVESNSFS